MSKSIAEKASLKTGHWIIFLLASPIGIHLSLLLASIVPFFAFYWIYEWNLFWFILTGTILIGAYYLMVQFVVLGLLAFISKNKPDYWISNIYMCFHIVLFGWLMAQFFSAFIQLDIKTFKSLKGILFLVTVAPAFLQIAFMALVVPFIKFEE